MTSHQAYSNGGLAAEQGVEHRAQAVHVARRAEPVELPLGLLGAHEGRSAERRPGDGVGRAALAQGRQHCAAGPGRFRFSAGARATSGTGAIGALGPAEHLGQAPVDDQRLVVRAEQHVGRLQIAVQHPPAVGIGHRVADAHEPAQQLPQLQRRAPSGRGRRRRRP